MATPRHKDSEEQPGSPRRLHRRMRANRLSRNRPRRQLPRVAVPSFFTLMNLFCGFIAITQIHDDQFDIACYMIVLAGFFDLLDGMMARLTKGQSLFGVELDSLSDAVSFGVAPAYLVYAFGLKEFGVFGLIVSALPALCSAVRLARFNVAFNGEHREDFEGLPTPAQALCIVALILNVNDGGALYRFSLADPSMLMPIVFVLSALMVSTVPFDSVPKMTAHYIRAHPRKALAYLMAAVTIIVFRQLGLLVVFGAYITFCVGYALFRIVRTILETPPDPPD